MMKKYAFLLSLFLLFSNSLMALSECVIKSEEIISTLSSENKSVVDYTNKIKTTGVRMYSNCLSSYVNLDVANSYCTNLIEGGYSDWRLPTLGESATSVGMGENGVPSCSGMTWTTPHNYGTYSCYLGGVNYSYKTCNLSMVRCVR